MVSLSRVMDDCTDWCSEKCCKQLSHALPFHCDPYWSNAYTHFVLSYRKNSCQRLCPAKPMCFFFGVDTPCFEPRCAALFEHGNLTLECDSYIMRYCAEQGITTDECKAYKDAKKRCGSTGKDWASCAAVSHSTGDFVAELKAARHHDRKPKKLNKGATEWITKFGLTSSLTEHRARTCVLRFETEGGSKMVPCAFNPNVLPGDLTTVVDADNVFAIIWVALCLTFYLLRCK